MLQLLLPPAFAGLDRLWGSDKPSFRGKKAVIAAIALGVGYLAGTWAGVAYGALWLVYRSIPFFRGSGAPQTASERIAAAARHAIVIPVAAFLAQQFGLDVMRTVLAFSGYAAVSVILAIGYGLIVLRHKAAGKPIGRQNDILELVRGSTYGLACFVSLMP